MASKRTLKRRRQRKFYGAAKLARGASSISTDWIVREQLAALTNPLKIASLFNRDYR